MSSPHPGKLTVNLHMGRYRVKGRAKLLQFCWEGKGRVLVRITGADRVRDKTQ